MLNEADYYYPIRETFSRQEVQERTGVSDDVLAFWIKQGLLLPLPAAPRAHRRFSYEQLHIAAVLNGMRSLGANVGVLRSFADAFQKGASLLSNTGFSREELHSACTLSWRLEEFRREKQVDVYHLLTPEPFSHRPADTEEEIVEDWLIGDRNEGASELLASFAKSLSRQSERSLSWLLQLTSSGNLIHPNDVGAHWIAWLDEDSNPHIVSSQAVILNELDGPMAAFYLPMPKLVANLWPDRLKSAQEIYEREREKSLLRRLAILQERDPAEADRFRLLHSLPASHSTGEEGEKTVDP